MMSKEVFQHFFQKNNRLRIIVLSVFGLVLIAVRFLWLDKFPPGINPDEYEVVLSAKNFWQKGVDINGVGFPKFFYATKGAGLAGLPYVVLSPFYGPLKFNLWNVRLPSVFLNISTILAISYLAFLLTNKRSIIWISLLVGLTNPWLFFYSRRIDELTLTLFFSVLGMVFFLKSEGRKKIFYSVPFFVASFFSYQGAKIPVLVFVTLLLFVSKIKLKIKALYWGLFLILPTVFFVYSFSSADSTYHLRKNEMIFSKLGEYSRLVNEQRRDSISFPFKNLYFNKYTYALNQMFKNYIGFISPNYLFFKGDDAFLFGESGVMLPIDLLFIIAGIAALARAKSGKNIKAWQLLGILFIAGPASSAIEINNTQYIFRGFLLIPAFILLISLGIDHVRNHFVSTKLYDLLIVFLYSLFFLIFLTFYFFRYPITGNQNHFMAERILVSYLHRVDQKGSIDNLAVVSSSPNTIINEYTFFNGSGGQVKATKDCSPIGDDGTYIVEAGISCPQEKGLKPVVIQNPKDTGTQYKIYNDGICSGVGLNSYRRFHFVSDFAIEKMDNKSFCERWIGRYE